jgi:hypothetical protein
MSWRRSCYDKVRRHRQRAQARDESGLKVDAATIHPCPDPGVCRFAGSVPAIGSIIESKQCSPAI